MLQLLSGHIGESYSGVITNVNNRGVFVQIDKYLCDGFVKAKICRAMSLGQPVSDVEGGRKDRGRSWIRVRAAASTSGIL